MPWQRVPVADELQPGSGCETVVDGTIVAIFRLADHCVAIDGTCPHHGGPLGQGELVGNTVTCPWHGLQINVETGDYFLASSCKLKTFSMRLGDEGWEILVNSK